MYTYYIIYVYSIFCNPHNSDLYLYIGRLVKLIDTVCNMHIRTVYYTYCTLCTTSYYTQYILCISRIYNTLQPS